MRASPSLIDLESHSVGGHCAGRRLSLRCLATKPSHSMTPARLSKEDHHVWNASDSAVSALKAQTIKEMISSQKRGK